MKRLLFGTTNPTRLQQMRLLLSPLPLHLVSLADLGLQLRVVEDGATAAENALIKAKAYFAVAGLPTLAVDTGLTIAALPADQQPGVFVRRIHTPMHEATDEEMLAHYQRALVVAGGQSIGQWQVAVALALTPQRVLQETFTIETWFTAIASPRRLPGEPLSALQLDRNTGKYYAELSPAERFATGALQTQKIFNFVQEHCDEL